MRGNLAAPMRWKSVFAGDYTIKGANHFSIVDALAQEKGALYQATRKLMKLDK